MRATATHNGLTVRVIAGTYNVIVGINLAESKRKGCLGFSIERTDLGPTGSKSSKSQQKSHWLPNLIRFPSDTNPTNIATDRAPLQKFRWGDYTTKPGFRYRYRVVPRYGKPSALTPPLDGQAGVSVDIATEDNNNPKTAVFFNRAAAASHAFEVQFPDITTEQLLLGKSPTAKKAKQWLARGLDEALLGFLKQAKDKNYSLHAAVYEFQKPELLAGLKAAKERKVDVQVVYHHRCKQVKGHNDPKDKTASKNDAAIKKAGIGKLCTPRNADPQGAIMHDKFVVLLRKVGKELVPQAVWTGSTNWTDGGIYGQLNVGHAVADTNLAQAYESCFQNLRADDDAKSLKMKLARLTPVPYPLPKNAGIWPVFSPQSKTTMLQVYTDICTNAKCLLVCAPFALFPSISSALAKKCPGTLRYLLIDTKKALGTEGVTIQEGVPQDTIAVATTLASPLHDFQGALLEGKESFLHAGIHIHAKIILADPFGDDPILVTGSANYSKNSTTVNDSNSLVIRGDTAVADIYATEFMRMFEHYHFRASLAKAKGAKTGKKATGKKPGKKAAASSTADVLCLKENDSWTDDYYKPGTHEELDRKLFAGVAK
jgi:phosphatidylserine/phosphatidylglycerophosphate/cardiolipin synthase-like enzyme